MSIRTILALLALAACTTEEPAPDPATSETAQAGQAVCDARKYGCDPLDRNARGVCDIACRFPGSYGLDHSGPIAGPAE